MTYLLEPDTGFGLDLFDRFGRDNASFPARRGNASPLAERSQMRFIILGEPNAVDQCAIELERRGFCDSYAWTPPIIVRASAPPIQSLPGELMRLHQRWYPFTGQQISF